VASGVGKPDVPADGGNPEIVGKGLPTYDVKSARREMLALGLLIADSGR
jgi:hypothetical protein